MASQPPGHSITGISMLQPSDLQIFRSTTSRTTCWSSDLGSEIHALPASWPLHHRDLGGPTFRSSDLQIYDLQACSPPACMHITINLSVTLPAWPNPTQPKST